MLLQYKEHVSNIIRSTINQTSVPSISNIFVQPGTSATAGGIDRSSNAKSTVRRGVSRTEGPLHNERGFLYDLQGISNQSLGASVFGSGHSYILGMYTDPSAPTELTAADMSLSTLYLHELHHRQVSVFAINILSAT